jgi:Ankyrin repeats (3 copies)
MDAAGAQMAELTEQFRSVNEQRFRQSELDTMVYEAVGTGSESFLRLAIAAGGSLDGAAGKHESPLGRAAREMKDDLAVLLLDKGANPNCPAGFTTAAMTYAAEGKTALLKKMLERGLNVATEHEGHTALFVAAVRGHADTVKLLLDHNADASKQCPWRGKMMTPIEMLDQMVYLFNEKLDPRYQQVRDALESQLAKPAPQAAKPATPV